MKPFLQSFLLISLFVGVPAAQQFDILILNGKIVDGTGNPAFHGDIAIQAGRIAAMGKLADRTAGRTIGAKGLVVAPLLWRKTRASRPEHRECSVPESLALLRPSG